MDLEKKNKVEKQNYVRFIQKSQKSISDQPLSVTEKLNPIHKIIEKF